MEKPNGSVESTLLFVIRSFRISTASSPSLLRSAPVWSEIMNRPPPFLTNVMIAVFSAVVNSVFGSGRTSVSKFDRSVVDEPPYVSALVAVFRL